MFHQIISIFSNTDIDSDYYLIVFSNFYFVFYHQGLFFFLLSLNSPNFPIVSFPYFFHFIKSFKPPWVSILWAVFIMAVLIPVLTLNFIFERFFPFSNQALFSSIHTIDLIIFDLSIICILFHIFCTIMLAF